MLIFRMNFFEKMLQYPQSVTNFPCEIRFVWVFPNFFIVLPWIIGDEILRIYSMEPLLNCIQTNGRTKCERFVRFSLDFVVSSKRLNSNRHPPEIEFVLRYIRHSNCELLSSTCTALCIFREYYVIGWNWLLCLLFSYSFFSFILIFT